MIRETTLILATLIVAGLAVAENDAFAFMPDGGRTLFSTVFTHSEFQEWALAQDKTAEDWEKEIATTAPTLEPDQIKTLAAYLSVVAPRDVDEAEPVTALPPDGRDLALMHCQSCHALFSGYLMHRRDRTGWLSTFVSPFHSGIPMTNMEKEIFADYSAINMPMRIEDVPPELRF